ncbi:MAG: elongation factor Ts [Candidatus Omnitrophica bacterium]|nr:elongation factor Ts [Candidatus Omnitrophota bacterium]MDD5654331.1 elongation factor Ts [Candidatus Omnitrophota bacterium]
MAVQLDLIKKLREKSSASIGDCRNALEEAGQDIEKAVLILRRRGMELADKKQDRVSKEGRIEAYVHAGNKIGVLLEVNSETDFVARNSDFCQFAKDVAMQIAACNPAYIRREDVPAEITKEQADFDEFCKQSCLMEQAFIKNPSLSIKDLLADLITKIGENIVIRRYARYKIGE